MNFVVRKGEVWEHTGWNWKRGTWKYKSIHGLFGVNNESHPIRCCLESLRSLEVVCLVCLIEGEE